MLARLLWRRRTQPQTNSYQYQQLYQQPQQDGGPAANHRRAFSAQPESAATSTANDIAFFLSNCKNRPVNGYASRAQSPGPFQRISPPPSPTSSRPSSRGRGRQGEKHRPFDFEDATSAHLTPATKAFVATCGTVAGHLVSNQEKREKVLLRAALAWEQLQDRLISPVPGENNLPQSPTFNRNNAKDSASAPAGPQLQATGTTPAAIHRGRTSGRKERPSVIKIDTTTRRVSAIAAEDVRRRSWPLDSGAVVIEPFTAVDVPAASAQPVPKRKDSGLEIEVNESKETTPLAAAKPSQAPQEATPDETPSAASAKVQQKKAHVQDIVDELENITESYDARSNNILGLYTMEKHKAAGTVPKRVPLPLDLFECAAERDHAAAAYNAGLCHERGIGGAKAVDLVRAIVLYRQAAVAGHHLAQYNLGILLLRKSSAAAMRENSAAAAKDAEEGLKWLQASARQGFPKANDVIAAAAPFGIGELENDLLSAF
ncbi:hypothetical protein DFJ77DRAFT_548474 [Powellomyces hirtus]|nr:hypothetical protein DFJ77DRAFT_548474 [Powellomyces hirtus]